MLVKIEARILIFPGTDFHCPSTSVPPGTFLGSGNHCNYRHRSRRRFFARTQVWRGGVVVNVGSRHKRSRVRLPAVPLTLGKLFTRMCLCRQFGTGQWAEVP